ncbi:hypothetical protein ACFX1S_032376 [Malus domestica]
MDSELYEEEPVRSGIITAIRLNVTTGEDILRISEETPISSASEVTDPRFGLPNPSGQCSTCGAENKLQNCEGHYGRIQFPCSIVHPYYLPEVVQILNKICVGCKSVKQDLKPKGADSLSGKRKRQEHKERKGCKYCKGSSLSYPRMKFRVSTRELFKRSCIIVEASGILPSDYWDFIPKDAQQDESCVKPNKRILSHAQVHHLLKDVDPNFVAKFVPITDSLSMDSFLVTPNCHRVTEFMHAFANGQRLMFDHRTTAYRKLVDFKGVANELGSRVLECLKISKLNSEKPGNDLIAAQLKNVKDDPSKSSGLRWIKDVFLGKRTDHCFRTVVVGDPNIKLSEIGIPSNIAERMHIAENLNRWNLERLGATCNLLLMFKQVMHVRRKGSIVLVHQTDELQMGDAIYRPLSDGDIVLINRPPSIHQHSLIALFVKILPAAPVVSINPLCCSPFRGDFDGDCLHGYVPQSVDAKVELRELVALDKQLINGQSGTNLLSLSQDSLTAAHLILEDGVLLNRSQMQQLQRFCCNELPSPAIIKAPSLNGPAWTGKQVFSMLLPLGFDYDFAPDGVCVRNGELLSSEGSSWLRDMSGNLYQSLIKHCQGPVLDILHAAQEVFCEWLSMRGLTVSLSDLYLASDSCSRNNLMEEIFCGLREAEQACIFRQLLVDSSRELLMGCAEENQSPVTSDVDYFCHEKQKSAALSQVVHDAFKQFFRDIQNLAYKYAGTDNSLMNMLKAGSKGNMQKLVQHSMCLGLQNSLVPLSFRIPNQLSCAAWNNQKAISSDQKVEGSSECVESYIPSAVVENSFLTGLNPLECFIHSVTSRDSSFSGNADLPGTLTRKLMFFMRDLCTAYDGTVRNAYGNKVVQFSYDISSPDSASTGDDESITACDGVGGQPVGSLSACAISEAAYSALDQPVSLLETSPLLNLKNILECGSKKSSAKQTMSLYLSEKLGRHRHGFEYAALEVKNYLEGLKFSDIVSTVLIIFSSQNGSKKRFSPWVTHFHIGKEIVGRRRLKMHSIVNSLYARCNSARPELKAILRSLLITSKDCSEAHTCKGDNDTFCITVTMAENHKSSSEQLDKARDLVIPFLLETVVKGLLEVKKVDILWNDQPKRSKVADGSSGELYLKVSMVGKSGKKRLWSMLLDSCIQIMNVIDWSRSHPDNVHEYCLAYGIDVGWNYFLNSLESTCNDIGKNILPEHLILVADCLTCTGEFVGLNAKGIAQQQEHASVSSPFMQACFSTPGACFVKAAKAGAMDELPGSLEALAWGKLPPSGTGRQFEVLFSQKGLNLSKPLDVYDMLRCQIGSICIKENEVKMPEVSNNSLDKCGSPYLLQNAKHVGLEKFESISKSVIKKYLKFNDILKWSQTWRHILRKYPVNETLNDEDKSKLMTALYFHPHRMDKIGPGVQDIKIGAHPKHEEAHCFMVVRTDGTVEDFSYHKCVMGALEIVAPQRVKSYQAKWFGRGPE